MKLTIVILMAILIEACVYGWLLGEECEQLKAENSELKQKIKYQKDKIDELNWAIAKMDLLIAGKTAEEIFQKSEKDIAPDEGNNSDDSNEDVIFID